MKNFTKIYILIISVIFSLLLTNSCKDDIDPENEEYFPEEPGLTVSTFIKGLDTPWQLAFTPDNRILFTERPGYVRSIVNGTLKPEPYINLRDSVIEAGESGLLGIAVDPGFDTNGYIYVGYSYEKSRDPLVIMNKLVRYKENDSTLAPVFDRILLDNIEGYINHNLGPIHFGPDGKIYMPVGERYIPEYAQDLTKLNGKILRLNTDGSAPDDNPFPGSLVYTYGHRNSQGLAWQPETNNLFNTEHGPSEEQGCCLDEINLIEAGNNYGWPVTRGMQENEGMERPIYTSGDVITWAPGGAVFVKNGPWSGSLIFAGLRGEALYRAIFDENDPIRIVSVEEHFKGRFGRLRTVAQGPDGRIYLATSNGDGRGIAMSPDDDRILILDFN